VPTYEYRCGACGHAFDVFQSITESPKRKCPACGKPKLERLIGTGGGILFKGSGFYQTDYRSSSYKEGQKSDSADSKPAASSGGDGKAGGEGKSKGKGKPEGKDAGGKSDASPKKTSG